MTNTLAALSLAQLRQALALKQQIEALESELAAILATPAVPASSARASELQHKLLQAPRQHTGAAAQAPRLPVQGAERRTSHKPRRAPAKEIGMLGLCNSADLPRPIRAARRKAGTQARTRRAASAKLP